MSDLLRWWRAATVFGALTLVLASISLVQGVPDCGVPRPAAMLDFELALTRADFGAVLDCAPRLAALDRSNVVDLLVFMWAYGGLLAFFALAAGVRRTAALGLAVLVVGSDFVETALLRQIAADWPSLDTALVMPLAVAVRVKFVAIAVLMGLAAVSIFRRATPGARGAALLMASGALGSLAIVHPDGRMLGTGLVAVAWLVMTAYAGVNARRPRPVRTSAGA